MALSPADHQKVKSLREQRGKLLHDARKILDTANGESRGLRDDEKNLWEGMNREIDDLKERMDMVESLSKKEDDNQDDEPDGDEKERKKRENSSDDDDDRDDEDNYDTDDERKRSIRLPDGRLAVLVPNGRTGLPNPNKRSNSRVERHPWETDGDFRTRQRRNSDQYRKVWSNYLAQGPDALIAPLAKRDISADSDIVGGYLVAPQQFVGDLIKFVDNMLWIRQFATKYIVQAAQTLGAPSLDNDPADADWTSELATGNVDNAMSFGKRELTPRPLAKRLKVSQKLLRMATIASTVQAYGANNTGSVEGLVRTRLGYKFAVAEEKAFMTGSGANQPLGLFTASSRGIDTSRDVLTGTSTGFQADQLIAAKHTLKPQYWGRPSTKWLFSRTALQYIRQLKDGTGQYIWRLGLAGGDPDTLLDIPCVLSEYVPNTFSTGNYVGMLGDFSFYWIADSEQMTIQRLVELYAEANQIGFIARRELDGMPVLAEAFVRLKTN